MKTLLDTLTKIYNSDTNDIRPIPFYILTTIISSIKKELKPNGNIDPILHDLEPVIKNLRVYDEYKNRPSKLKEILGNKTDEFLDKFDEISSIDELKEFSKTIDEIKEKIEALNKQPNFVSSFQTRLPDWETSTVKVYKLKSSEQDRQYTMGTNWYIKNKATFNTYLKERDIYVIIPKKHGTIKTIKGFTAITQEEKYLMTLAKVDPNTLNKVLKSKEIIKKLEASNEYKSKVENLKRVISNKSNEIKNYIKTTKAFKDLYEMEDTLNAFENLFSTSLIKNKDQATNAFLDYISYNKDYVSEHIQFYLSDEFNEKIGLKNVLFRILIKDFYKFNKIAKLKFTKAYDKSSEEIFNKFLDEEIQHKIFSLTNIELEDPNLPIKPKLDTMAKLNMNIINYITNFNEFKELVTFITDNLKQYEKYFRKNTKPISAYFEIADNKNQHSIEISKKVLELIKEIPELYDIAKRSFDEFYNKSKTISVNVPYIENKDIPEDILSYINYTVLPKVLEPVNTSLYKEIADLIVKLAKAVYFVEGYYVALSDSNVNNDITGVFDTLYAYEDFNPSPTVAIASKIIIDNLFDNLEKYKSKIETSFAKVFSGLELEEESFSEEEKEFLKIAKSSKLPQL